jgi:MtN3 and saliva related transmembrane protein
MNTASYVAALGLAAGFCTTAAFVPQVVRTWTTRSAEDISLGMLVIFVTGVALWLGYGAMLGDWPIILANGATLLLAGSILYFKLLVEGGRD